MNRHKHKLTKKLFAAGASLALTAILSAFPVAAQPSKNNAPPAPFQGMAGDQKKDEPVSIEAATLEVRDKKKTATFSGNVQVVQGDTTMKCARLVVFYGEEMGIAANGDKPAATTAVSTSKSTPGMPQGAQNIQKIVAEGGVTVITKDQNAKGDEATYDLRTKTITLNGHVTISQGQNVINGERVVVDTVTGNARVESGSSSAGTGASAGAGGPQTRVKALITPNKSPGGGPTNSMTFVPSGPAPTN